MVEWVELIVASQIHQLALKLTLAIRVTNKTRKALSTLEVN